MEKSSKDKRTIRSDERLFDIIEYIQEEKNVGVTDIAEHIDMAKSTVHGHLVTLQRHGYVINNGGEYQLGLQFLNHGKHVQTSYKLYSIGQKKVEQLAQETGERAWCVVEENGLGYYLAGAKGEHSVHPPVHIGEPIHLHQLSAGKAILAHLPESRVESIIDQHGLPEKTSNTITSKEQLFTELEIIQDQGYATNDGESLQNLYAVGAPIIDKNGNVRGALSISGPTNRLRSEDTQAKLVSLILGAANELQINIIHL